jgi:hypothetical protein
MDKVEDRRTMKETDWAMNERKRQGRRLDKCRLKINTDIRNLAAIIECDLQALLDLV